MRFTILLILTILLSGCAKQPVASETIADSAQNSIVAIENSLPNGCNTPAIKSQLNAIKSQITAISSSCETEKQIITQEKIKWKTAFFGLALVMIAYFVRKIII